MKKLTKEQIIMLHSALVERFGGQDGLRDEGMLDSALNTPFQTFFRQRALSRLVIQSCEARFRTNCKSPVHRREQAYRHSRNADISPAQQYRA